MELNKKTQTREINLSSDNISDRTVLLSFSSETPVKREINGQTYNEILLHGMQNVDLSRLQNDAALLFNHDFDSLIGVVESVNIDTDKIGRALVRFSEYGLGEEKYNQVQEGVLTKVSVGYEINDYEFRGNDLLITRWTPYEISLVSVPADDAVGVGRSIESDDEVLAYLKEHPELLNKIQEQHAEDTDTDEVIDDLDSTTTESDTDNEVSNESEEINKEEETRIHEINSMGKVFGLEQRIVQEAINNKKSVEEFKRQMIFKEETQMEENFSLQNTIRSLINGEKSAGEYNNHGIVLPVSAFQRVSTATNSAGTLIQNTIQYDSFIDVVRQNSVLKNFPIKIFSGLEGDGNLELPMLLDDYTGSFGFVDEDVAATDTNAVFQNIVLSPRTFTGSVYLTRLLQKSVSAAERYLTETLISGSAEKLERAVISKVISGGVKETIAVADLTYEKVLSVIGDIGNMKVASDKLSIVLSPSLKAKLKGVKITPEQFLIDSNDRMLGIPVYEYVFAAADRDQFIIGDFSQIVMAEWSTLAIDRDDTTSRAKGGVHLRVWADIDFNITRPEYFTVVKVTE
ncbi:phage major capsid protein [Candidatus Symbiopectobacterium sp. NZEC135]|uniref:phage major capsid protein n=1 Tax=Candidatus Symbiopectobacterium sp. NZEC135 TaxID=2820471 RepID=UPI00222738CC|nr:phage major capsid protein [Candidatus Symbiopectobacterium sp. NZEC135]MCW2478124.1 phage major capsid protein [Candidatus Symbiopectobacterium sp. NZEC135]